MPAAYCSVCKRVASSHRSFHVHALLNPSAPKLTVRRFARAYVPCAAVLWNRNRPSPAGHQRRIALCISAMRVVRCASAPLCGRFDAFAGCACWGKMNRRLPLFAHTAETGKTKICQDLYGTKSPGNDPSPVRQESSRTQYSLSESRNIFQKRGKAKRVTHIMVKKYAVLFGGRKCCHRLCRQHEQRTNDHGRMKY